MTTHPDPEQRPKRLSLSHALELALSRDRAVTPTVELSRNSKGDTQIAVKAAGDDLAAVERQAVEVYERLRERYPLTSQGGVV